MAAEKSHREYQEYCAARGGALGNLHSDSLLETASLQLGREATIQEATAMVNSFPWAILLEPALERRRLEQEIAQEIAAVEAAEKARRS